MPAIVGEFGAQLSRLLREYPHCFLLRKYERGETIFQEGEAAEAVYLVRTGIVKAFKFSPKSEPFTMEIMVPGKLFGMIAAMDRKPYPVSAVPLQASEIYRIRAADFDWMMQKNPDFSRQVYSEIGSHMRHAQEMRSLSKESVEKRIAAVLCLLSDALGARLEVRREEIAEMAGCTPETAIRVLAGFRKKKIIRSGWKWITIADPDRLGRLTARE